LRTAGSEMDIGDKQSAKAPFRQLVTHSVTSHAEQLADSRDNVMTGPFTFCLDISADERFAFGSRRKPVPAFPDRALSLGRIEIGCAHPRKRPVPARINRPPCSEERIAAPCDNQATWIVIPAHGAGDQGRVFDDGYGRTT
jgi:hypothetical protein